MDELDLEAIEERANAAKPGPWHYLHGYGFDWHPSGDGPSTPNVVFACRAREDVPALVAEVRRLRAGTDALNNHAAALSATLEDLRRAEREIGALLTANGCDCDCEHDAEGHDDDCERCLACRVEAALRGSR